MRLRPGALDRPDHTSATSVGLATSAAPSHRPGHGALPPPASVCCRVPPAHAVVKAAAALAFVLASMVYPDPVGVFLAWLASLVFGGYALRDLVAPVRVKADTRGITVVTGYASRRRHPWRDVEVVRVDRRQRLGVRTELLEVDAGGALYLFSRFELGRPVAEVAAKLQRLRAFGAAPRP